MDSREIMKSIRDNWKLDAMQECNDKYFFSYEDVDAILNNHKCYVVGRKGMGKTAICQHIVNVNKYNHFAEKLSFKNFPFNELYSLQNKSYTAQSQYISLWKYLIYSTICKLMSKNENISEDLRKDVLLKLYPANDIRQLSRKIVEWTSLEFGADILGNGGSVKVERNIRENDLTWVSKINILEDIIFQYCDDSKYYIIFDELDEDYRDVSADNMQQYVCLLTGLFKAVQEVKCVFREKHIMPIVFLRNDIYDQLNDADKNKWSDFKIDLDWNINKMKQLISYRIARDANDKKLAFDFKQAWNSIFEYGDISYGYKQLKHMTKFEFICNSTHFRPRDFIKYIQACCKLAIEKGERYISNETIKGVDREFSNYLKSEIIDEVYPIIPEINNIFNILSQQRKQLFKQTEFISSYKDAMEKKLVTNENVEYILEVLFNFSIIGNQHKHQKNRTFFRYLCTNMTYNRDEVIVIHRGLLKALQIF